MNRSKYARNWARNKRSSDPKFRSKEAEKAKKYYWANVEERRAYATQYRKDHPRKVKAATAAWFANNKEYRKKYKAEYREQHAAQIKAYRRANKERQIVYKANRKTRLTNAGGKFTVKQWRELCALYGSRCLCCSRKKPLTVDHVIPVSKGGTSDIDNIQPLCGPCNSTKHDNVVDYRKG